MNANIEKALAAANDTCELWIGAGVSDRVADLFKEQYPAMPAVIVADTTTWQVLGKKISRLFFFVYVIRYVVLDWGPTLLSEWKGVSIEHAGWMVAAFEISGIIGMLAAGWATDRFFGGRSPRVCVFCMGFATLFIFLFWLLDTPPMWLASLLLMAAGFFIYGPQALVGIAAANMATKRAAATAGGFTGLFGYASTLVSGWGLGYLATNYGWSLAISVLIGIGITGTLVFMLAWNAKADGYGTK